jgi:pyruvate,water dikinase
MLHKKRRWRNGADYNFRLRYETLRSILNKNGDVLQLLSDLEADLNHFSRQDFRVRSSLRRLLDETLLMAQELNLLADNRYSDLYDSIFRIGAEIDSVMKRTPTPEDQPIAVTLDEDLSLDPAVVGGKAVGVASLRRLLPESVPAGFTVTTSAYRLFLKENRLMDRIRLLLSDIEVVVDHDQFKARTQTIRDLIRSASMPKEMLEAINKYASKFSDQAAAGWAVRSSATSEDERFTFAGQFDSRLMVEPGRLDEAYRFVLASRFSDRAVIYRLHCGFSEVDTPMAVLFMPMIVPQAAGVIYTTDPQEMDSPAMVINAVPGLGEEVVKGTSRADTFFISKEQNPKVLRIKVDPERGQKRDYLPEEKILAIGSMAFKIAQAFGHEMDIEWAIDGNGHIWLLQGRRINVATEEKIREGKMKRALPLIEGGVTIFPGRAEGSVIWLSPGADASSVPKGSVLVVNQPHPELAVALPRIAALLAVEGNPVGHLSALLREFAVPSIFQLGDTAKRLLFKTMVSVDATNRKIYEGSIWPGVKDRVLNRISSERRPRSGELHDLVLAFTMTDPYAASFKAKNCRSIHDAVRFMHEMSVRSMFDFGDEQTKAWPKTRKPYRLKTALPLKLNLIDLDGCVSGVEKEVDPEQIQSIPFRALWRGISDPKLPWPERWEGEFFNLPSGFRETVLGGKGPRRPTDANYAMVASDYINLNARMAFHYAMIDAIVEPGGENNHVQFWFRGGGAADENRARRAHFLERVLRQLRFGVDRRGDLVNAWMRRYPQADSEQALESIGRLIVCARQLDMLMKSDASITMYAERFLTGQYQAFA